MTTEDPPASDHDASEQALGEAIATQTAIGARLLTVADVAERLAVTQDAVRQQLEDGTLPPPIHLGNDVEVWTEDVIRATSASCRRYASKAGVARLTGRDPSRVTRWYAERALPPPDAWTTETNALWQAATSSG